MWKKRSKQAVKKPIMKNKNVFIHKAIKNIKFKNKAKKMVELHKKQALFEKLHSEKNSANLELGREYLQLINKSHEAEEIEAYDELMSSLSTNQTNGTHMAHLASGFRTNQYQLQSEHKFPMDNIRNDILVEELKENDVKLDYIKKIDDPFALHMNFELLPEHVENTSASDAMVENFLWPNLGNITVEIPNLSGNFTFSTGLLEKFRNPPKKLKSDDLRLMKVKALPLCGIETLSPLQSELFTIINQYHDFYYPTRSCNEINSLCWVYSIHILNHMLKTRSCVLQHNMKLRGAKSNDILHSKIPDSYRDQGLVRPKILVVVPFRKSAYQVVSNIIQLLYDNNIESCKSNGKVINCSRFIDEYTGNTLRFTTKKPKPDDFRNIFKGNIDDNFRIGISLSKKCLKLYTDFNASDIIIASPLGLRLIIGASGSEERHYDFLNSIEILVLDQAEIFLAQNWENVLLIFDHMHLQPQSLQNTDLQRVRPWCLNGLSRYYRQTIILSSHELPELRSLYNNKCINYNGKVHVSNPIMNGVIGNVFVTIPQVFHFLDIPNLESLFELRFRYFIHEILPKFRKPLFGHCMIYVPSYFDFVRIRNYLKSETISFAQICEYTANKKIARARDMFFHSGVHFMLYSERSHFFRRTRIKGIRHLIMYQPPMWPQLYAELINMMNNNNQNSNDGLEGSMSVTILYTKYDSLQLTNVLGNKVALSLLNSDKTVQALTIK